MTTSDRPLAGHAVLVTGSSSGIGEASARAFARLGASVLVNSARSVEAGEAVAASLPDALYVQGDITEPEVPERLVAAALERWGRLDTLVNNAGTTAVIPHHDVAGGLRRRLAPHLRGQRLRHVGHVGRRLARAWPTARAGAS